MKRHLYAIFLFFILLSTFCIGFFSLLTNIGDYPSVIERFVQPLVTLEGLSNTNFSYRALPNISTLMTLIYVLMVFFEALLSVFAIKALYELLIKGNIDTAIEWGQVAALYGVIFWAFIFFTVGGDWFLAWKRDTLKYLQADAMRYVQLMFIYYVVLWRMQEDNAVFYC